MYMKKKWITLFIISVTIGILACLQWGSKIMDTLTPNPHFAPLTQHPINKSETTEDNIPLIEGYSSTIESFRNGYVQDVFILSHRIFIPDKEEFAREVIQMIIDNSLKGILFSYDINGYPNELHITVYLNEAAHRSGNSSFKISYTQDIQNGFRYNIKDDLEKFRLEIFEE